MAQASSLEGITYDTATFSGDGDYRGCQFHNVSQDEKGSENLDLHVGTAADCWTELEEGAGPGTSIAGLGDEAFGFATGVAVHVGATCVDIDGGTTAEIHSDWSADTALLKVVLSGLN